MIIDLFVDKKRKKHRDKQMNEKIDSIRSQINDTKTMFNESTDASEIEQLVYKLKELDLSYSNIIKKAKLENIYRKVYEDKIWKIKY